MFHWSQEEIVLLRQYYSTTDRVFLEQLFPDHSWRSILHKANRLKFGNTPIIHRLRPSSIRMLKDVEQAYLAGFLDGEGTITISVKRSDKNNVMPHMVPLIILTNTDKSLIDDLRLLLPGSTIKTGKETIIRKAIYAIQIAKLLDIEALLKQLLPFLRSKNKQAELLLEYCSLRKKDNMLSYNDRLFQIAEEVRFLNRKGPHSAK